MKTEKDNSQLFTSKRILVTGGTGSLGKVLVRRILSGEFGRPAAVTVFSRDEAKQHAMRVDFHHMSVAREDLIYSDYSSLLHFKIGDVRNYASVSTALRNIDIVFNAAALKQVPSCEYFPYEATMTNINGPENIIRAIESMQLPVETVIGISTDKACKPVNVMGMSKAIQERVFISANIRVPDTRFICARYGNVLASRGSVIPLFHNQINLNQPVTITTSGMTRFLLSLDQAVDTIIDAYRLGDPGDIFIPRIPASKITDIAKALIGDRGNEIIEIGIRPGEKEDEILIAEDEASRTVEREAYFVIRSSLPEIADSGSLKPAIDTEYSSGTDLMSLEETRQMLADRKMLVEDNPDFSREFG